MGQIKEINIKSCTYYLFNDMVNIKNFDPNCVEIDKTSYKNIDICYIGCITIKDHVNIHSVNPLYCIIDKADDFTAGNPNGKETMLK